MQTNYLSWLLIWCLVPALSGQVNERLRAVVADTSGQEWARHLPALQDADYDAYDGESKRLLAQILASPTVGNYPEYIKLAGFVADEELLALVPTEARTSDAVKRALSLARVRAGNEERRANLLKNLRAIPLDDDFVYTVVPLLVYTRQREIFDYLFGLVMVENSSCTPADAELEGRIDCGYRLIERLAPAIEDFPVQADDEGNLLTDDYAAALVAVRQWYALHQLSYSIRTNTY